MKLTITLITSIFIMSTSSFAATTMSEVTVVGSKENIQSLAGSGDYLDFDDIHTHNYGDVNRILRKVPGVYLREEDGYGLFPNISLRGVDMGRSGKVSLMEDGILTAPAPYSAPSAYYSPTVGRMHAIEVLKGSSQIKYGPHTTGGVVNYVSTPIPENNTFYINTIGGTDFREDAEHRTHTFGGGTYDTPLGEFGQLIEFFGRYQDGFKEIDVKPDFNKDSDDTGFYQIDTMYKVSWKPDAESKHKLEGKLGYTTLEAQETYLGLNDEDFRNNPYRRYAASRFDNIETHHLRSYLRYTTDLVEDTLKFSTTGYFNKFYRNWYKLHDRVDAAAIAGTGDRLSISQALESPLHLAVLKGDVAGSFRYRNNRRYYYTAGLDNKFTYDFELLDMQHRFEFGYRYHQDRIRRYQNNVNYTQDAEGRIVSEVGSARGSAGNRRQHTEAHAFYWQDEISISNNITVTPGLRWEWIQQEFKNFQNNTVGKANYDVLAPGVGIHFQATDKIAIFGNYHRGFSVPSPNGATQSGLHEEKSDAYEVGARFEDDVLSAEAIFFYTNFDDLIVTDNIGGAGSGADENAGDINSLGVEAKVRFDLGKYLEKEYRNPYYASFTYTRARLDGDASSTDPESIFSGGLDGNDVPYIPEFQFTIGTGFEYKNFGIYVDSSYYDRTFASASNTTDQRNPITGLRDARFGETDRYFIVDLTAKLQVTDNIEIYASLKNLFDNEYLASRQPHGPRPGRPFSGTAGVKARWG